MTTYLRRALPRLAAEFANLERLRRADETPVLLQVEGCRVAIDMLTRLQADLVRRARDEDNASWADVGAAAGIARSSAHERFGKWQRLS